MTLEAAKASIRPGQTVQFVANRGGASIKAKVVKKYEYHFLTKVGQWYECFTYIDVMLGEVQVMNR